MDRLFRNLGITNEQKNPPQAQNNTPVRRHDQAGTSRINSHHFPHEFMRIVTEANRLVQLEHTNLKRKHTLAHDAAKTGDLNLLHEAIHRNININTPNKLNMTPLFLAVLSNKKDMVSKLLEIGARLDIPGSDSATLACLASKFGHEDILRKLAEKDFNSLSNTGARDDLIPAQEAAKHDRVNILKLLVELKVLDLTKKEEVNKLIELARKNESLGALCYLILPPSNKEAIQVIQGEQTLTLDDLKNWSRHCSGIEDLRLIIQAIFTAWVNDDIDGNNQDTQNLLKSFFTKTLGNVIEKFDTYDGLGSQIQCIKNMNREGVINSV